jgi:hypothetical protein
LNGFVDCTFNLFWGRSCLGSIHEGSSRGRKAEAASDRDLIARQWSSRGVDTDAVEPLRNRPTPWYGDMDLIRD